ncbi:T9SS type A sorting domain-containing protein [Rubrivirga sp.]|uniref:T9SS type A sorting domain-containing protein n=1 Tax=Rubrivirga sp. TaxID=1885344 RepID=UPI003C789A9C
MLLRFALFTALALGFALEASAQITLRATDPIIYLQGESRVVSAEIENEDGADTAALNALVAQSGPNQTWDFTGLNVTQELVGTARALNGAAGPLASEAPFNDATLTYEFSLVTEQDGESVLFEGFSYVELRSDGLYQLGSFGQTTFGSDSFEATFVFEPDGQLVAPTTISFGDTWTDSYTLDVVLLSETDVSYEADGWGQVILPGVDGPVPALRIRSDVSTTVSGTTFESTGYAFRTATALNATILVDGPDPFGDVPPPTASISTSTPTGSTSQTDRPDDEYTLGSARPNPTADRAALDLTVPAPGSAMVTVFDMTGRQALAPVHLALAAGPNGLEVGTAGLPAGVYLVRVDVDGRVLSRPLTVVR